MRPSVVIATYNAPRELEFALCGVARQTRAPHEVVIADDGSGPETRAVVERWRDRLGCPLLHAWQADRGYRKARIVNEAVRRTSGDWLVFLDGDTFPHPAWVADHLQVAAPLTVACGRRVKLGPRLSARITLADIEAGRLDRPTGALFWSAIRGDTQRLGLGLRLPRRLARMLHPRARKLMGVNYSLPRSTFFAVNGMDEAWTFYGREDLDLEFRLKRAGCHFYPLLNRAVVFHVHHPERERSAEALQLAEAQAGATHVRCERGIELGRPFDPAG